MRNAWRPGVAPWAVHALRSGGTAHVPVADPQPFPDMGAPDLPGRPVPVHTPGHTDGHCAFHLPEAGVVISGDGLVSDNPHRPRRTPSRSSWVTSWHPDRGSFTAAPYRCRPATTGTGSLTWSARRARSVRAASLVSPAQSDGRRVPLRGRGDGVPVAGEEVDTPGHASSSSSSVAGISGVGSGKWMVLGLSRQGSDLLDAVHEAFVVGAVAVRAALGGDQTLFVVPAQQSPRRAGALRQLSDPHVTARRRAHRGARHLAVTRSPGHQVNR